jgi:hypothetical protein
MTPTALHRATRLLAVLWPSFLVAILMEGLVFTLFDPASLRWTDSMGEPLSPLAVYSVGFLAIWALMSLAVTLGRAFPLPPEDPARLAG